MNYNHIKLTPSKTYRFGSFYLIFLHYHTIINRIVVMQKKTNISLSTDNFVSCLS